MKQINLLDIAKNISSWAELEARISDLSQESERGEVFEEFCKAFFLLDPVFQFEKIYRYNDIPPSLKERLGYPGTKDIGIDGLAVTLDEKLFAYQAKFRKDRNNIPTLRELSTFFTVSDRADWRITITNANSLPSAINDRTKSSRVLVDRFDQLEPEFFDRLRLYLKEKCIKPPSKKTPHRTQREAIDAALLHFEDQNRGQLILPCGTGKTLTAMWIAEKIGGSRILIMVPSLALMSQTLREWAANTSIKPFRYLCLCSDPTVDLGNDSPIEHLYEMDIPVTTDVTAVSDFLLNERHVISILFSTYQSSKVLSEAVLKTDTIFDVGIFDEAHRTTGTKVGVWNIALDDKNVPIEKRIFMTATPRIYAPHIIKKAKEEDILICSMDDSNVYGNPYYEMTFGKAIEENLITDYKVVVICVTDSEVKEIIQRGGRVITDDDHEWDAKAFAKRVALVKGINAYGLRKVFTFHGRVKGAKAFTDTNTPYGIHHVFKMLLPENPSYPSPLERGVGVCTTPPSMGGEKGRVKFFHVNGTMSSGIRNSLVKEFKEADIGIMSNARCLTEGVDVPVVDTVAFIDPKRSLIDIVQATGRAMRKAEWKEKGYIFIPVVVEEDADPEKIIESSDFDTVWQVLQAMVDQDQRLQDIVSQLRVLQGKGEEDTQAWKDAMKEYTEKVEFYNLPVKIDQTRFITTLYTRTVEMIGKSWDFWYGLLKKYVERVGNARVLKDHIEDNYKLGNWVQNMRSRRERLSEKQIEALEKLPGWVWATRIRHKLTWDERYNLLREFISREGHSIIPSDFKVGELNLLKWVSGLRTSYRRGRLSEEKIKKLEQLNGWDWNPYDTEWERNYRQLLAFVKREGYALVPNQHIEGGIKLGRWVISQRSTRVRNKLTEERRKALESLPGWTWNVANTRWENSYRHLLSFVNHEGHAKVPRGHIEGGFKLGQWVTLQRVAYRKKKLPQNKITWLESLQGWTWDPYKAEWEEGYERLLSFVKRKGHANIPANYKENGFKLGIWVVSQRQRYKEGKLSADYTQALEKVPDWTWDVLESQWNEGYQYLLKFIEREKHAKVPYNHREDGYKLGQFVVTQRSNYKKGKLPNHRIEALEKLPGWVWDIGDIQWETGYEYLLRYVNREGHTKIKANWIENGFNLGHWVNRQRTRKNNLSDKQIKKLEKLRGWVWDVRKSWWEDAYQYLLRYVGREGHARVPAKHSESSFKLGGWVRKQRLDYQKGRISKERIMLLEKISGWSWKLC